MSRFVLSIVTALAFSVGMAVAQTNSTPSSQGTQGRSPGMEQQQHPNQPGATEQGSYPQTGTTDQNTTTTHNEAEKGEHKLKGCVQSQGGQSMLETHKGKEIALSGQDVSAHNGHEVELKGTWESAGNAGMSQSSAGASGEKTFNVTSLKMISESCAGKSKGTSGMGSSPSGGATSNPTGSTPSGSNPTQPQ